MKKNILLEIIHKQTGELYVIVHPAHPEKYYHFHITKGILKHLRYLEIYTLEIFGRRFK